MTGDLTMLLLVHACEYVFVQRVHYTYQVVATDIIRIIAVVVVVEFSSRKKLLLRGAIVIRTYDGPKKSYITLILHAILGPDYYVQHKTLDKKQESWSRLDFLLDSWCVLHY